MDLLHRARGWVMPILSVLFVLFGLIGALGLPRFYVLMAVTGLLILVGIYDLVQHKHSILRNYPVIGHLRFLLEGTGPEIHQYFVESNTSGRPFNRDARDLMYRRSKGVEAVKPFGTELDVYGYGYGFISHSARPGLGSRIPAETFVWRSGGRIVGSPIRLPC